MNKNGHIPPRLAEKLLLRFLRTDLAEEVLGDLEEKFYVVAERKSLFRARLNYWYQVIHYLRPFAVRKSKKNYSNHTAMFQHSLLLSYRSFLRYKGTFLINLAGLASGLACFMLIALWVQDELRIDKFHEHDEQLYRLVSDSHSNETLLNTSSIVANELAGNLPEIESLVHSSWGALKSSLGNHQNHLAFTGEFASPGFFKMFTYPLVHGRPGDVLIKPNSIVVSEETALKLFHTTDVVGKTLEWRWFSWMEEATITGVFKDVPANSSMKFDYVLSYNIFEAHFKERIERGNYNTRTYLKLAEGTDAEELNAKMSAYMQEHHPDRSWVPFVIPYSSYHLYNTYENQKASGGRIVYVRLLSVAAILILVIACINFMNLSTARASRRMKEIGIKKVFGASRKVLVFQYMVEAVSMSTLAGIGSLLLVLLFLPQFNALTGKQLTLLPSIELAAVFIGVILITGLLSGSYPALYLSSFRPAAVLKGKLTAGFGEKWLRSGLVIFQFGVALILIASVLVVHKQLVFIESKDLGYDQSSIILFNTNGLVAEKQETFLAEVEKLPGVVGASSMSHALVGGQASTNAVQWEGYDPEHLVWFEHGTVNYGMLEMLGIEMAAGRTFSEEYGSEDTKVIINETALKRMELKDPIGKSLTISGTGYQVIGVMKDFHFESLHEPVKPVFLRLTSRWALKIAVRLEPGTENETLAGIEELYRSFQTGFPFEYTFLDQDNQAKYAAEAKIAGLSSYFAGIAIIISCLGLLGLAAYATERRIKEIGIRKVLGSGMPAVVWLLVKDLTKTVAVAIGIGLPLSYWLTKDWLETFAYRIELQWWYFLGAGAVILSVAWLTVSFLTIKAANGNPVQCLRNE